MIKDKIKRNFLLSLLGDEYNNYTDEEKIDIFKEYKKIINLFRNKGETLATISAKMNCKLYIIRGMINESTVLRQSHMSYEKYKKIKHLKEEGNSYYIIAKWLKMSHGNLYRILALKFPGIYIHIIEHFNLEHYRALKERCYEIYQDVRFKLKDGSKYRNIELLAYLVIYTFLKAEGVNLKLHNYLLFVSMNRIEFNKGLIKILKVFPLYSKMTNRKIFVRKQILEVISQFNFSYKFLKFSDLYLEKFWAYIGNTVNKVIAGVVCALVMNRLNIDKPRLPELSKMLEIRESSVHYQIRNNILKRMNIVDFKGIKNSSEVIRSIL